MNNVIKLKDAKPAKYRTSSSQDKLPFKIVLAADYLHNNHDSLFGTKVIKGWYGVFFQRGLVEDLYLLAPLGKKGKWTKKEFSNDIDAMMYLMKRFVFSMVNDSNTFVIREPYKKGEILNYFNIKLRTYFRFYIKDIKIFRKTFYIDPDRVPGVDLYKKLNEFPMFERYIYFNKCFYNVVEDITKLNFPMKDYVTIICDTYGFIPHNTKILEIFERKTC